jgi:protein TonB
MTRYVTATGLAILVTFALFWAMQALITVGYELAEGGEPLSIEFVRLRKDNTPPQSKREPPKREKPKQPPPPPDISQSRSNLDPGEGVAALAPQIDASANLDSGITGTGGTDRDVVPLVQTEPEYPAQAESRGIVGWVTVEFTIAKTGAVKDPVVIASRPARIFDRAALTAVRRWKYNPKILDGAAVERPGVQITFEFKP